MISSITTPEPYTHKYHKMFSFSHVSLAKLTNQNRKALYHTSHLRVNFQAKETSKKRFL